MPSMACGTEAGGARAGRGDPDGDGGRLCGAGAPTSAGTTTVCGLTGAASAATETPTDPEAASFAEAGAPPAVSAAHPPAVSTADSRRRRPHGRRPEVAPEEDDCTVAPGSTGAVGCRGMRCAHAAPAASDTVSPFSSIREAADVLHLDASGSSGEDALPDGHAGQDHSAPSETMEAQRRSA
ncbi:hypothetical protein SAMN05428965_0874 [Geodermatophilus sp. DSM 45219]|nr:hypothetical protein SAMN05428965_0874 [Geodermatophilus sp. DSM 45219]